MEQVSGGICCMPAGETRYPPRWQQGSCSLGGQWGTGGGTSDQQVLAKRDQDWWLLPDGAENASAGFPQKVLGPARNQAVESHGHHRMQWPQGLLLARCLLP